MDLTKASELFDELRGKIESHRNYLSANETRTRQVLIDPLLRELGWDVTDPDQVQLEYSTAAGGADYALMRNGNAVAVIDARKLAMPLEERETMRVLNYADIRGIPYMITSNGDEWQMYEVLSRMPIEERIKTEFSVTRTPTHESVLRSLLIWNINLVSNSVPVFAGESALHASISVHVDKPSTIQDASIEGINKRRNTRSLEVAQEPNPGWFSITDRSINPTGKKPIAMKIQEEEYKLNPRQWTKFDQCIGSWLINSGRIERSDCPIFITKSPRGNCFIDIKPIHPDGNKFRSHEELPNGMYMETGFSAKDHLINMRKLLEQYCIDPSSVYVRLN